MLLLFDGVVAVAAADAVAACLLLADVGCCC